MERLRLVDGDVDTAVVAQYEASRRDALRQGLGLGGKVVVATSIPLLLSVRNAFAQAEGDAAILRAAIGLEQVAVFVYDRVARGGVLPRELRRVAERFRDQEQEHADALTAALEELGGRAPAAPTSVEDVERVQAGLDDARSVASIASFAIELESSAIAAYHEAHTKLEDAGLLQTGASIMANEAQHLVVLRRAIDRDPVPGAFETGRA